MYIFQLTLSNQKITKVTKNQPPIQMHNFKGHTEFIVFIIL